MNAKDRTEKTNGPNTPEWKVYFDGNFWGHRGRARAGKEIALDKQFLWCGEVWKIPAIYICSKGLVVDFCAQIPADRMLAFLNKWDFDKESEFTDEQQMMIRAENPFAINIRPKLILNGTIISGVHGSGVSWSPCHPEGNAIEAQSVLRHFDLDPDQGWAIWRWAFPWNKKRKPQITALSVIMEQELVAMAGPHFHISKPGECYEFTDPNQNTQHILTVQEYEQQEMKEHVDTHNQEFQTHYTAMSYTLAPDLPEGTFTITDCVRSDQPREKCTDLDGPQVFSTICVAVGVNEKDGGSGQEKLHAAASALHFEPVDDVEWRMVFYEKRREDITVEIGTKEIFDHQA